MIWPKMMFGTLILGATMLAQSQQPAPPPPRFLGPPIHKDDAQSQGAKPRAGARHGDWLQKFKDLPPDQQKAALENDPNFKKLPPERQEKLRQRLAQFNNLPPEQREKIVKRMRRFENLTPAQKQQARALAQRYREVPVERRQKMRQAMRDLALMSPDDRNKALDSERFKNTFSDTEREIMRGMAEMRTNLNGAQSD